MDVWLARNMFKLCVIFLFIFLNIFTKVPGGLRLRATFISYTGHLGFSMEVLMCSVQCSDNTVQCTVFRFNDLVLECSVCCTVLIVLCSALFSSWLDPLSSDAYYDNSPPPNFPDPSL